ncbi:Arc family DNA-binding protein [Acinetobacter johnsonii]|uniref:Arc family DNA-binding protein n=1 Tax=Acinetobacter johnsonii TaxID=40214 RepID=UPI0030FCA09A
MSREDPQLKIRLPLELKEKITESAAEHGRSINSEVVARLEESFTSGLVASDPYKRMLLAVIAGILAEQADREKPSFEEAIDRIVKAIMIDENTLQNRLGIKKAP